MVFWGMEVKPGRPYYHTSEEWSGQLHVSMATLGLGTATSKSVLQCNVGNKSPILLCCLFPERKECVKLNLEFGEKELIFSVVGPRSIHLSGFYHAPSRTPNEESEPPGVDIAQTESDESDDSDDGYGGSFINDGSPEMSFDSSEDESFDEKKLMKSHSESDEEAKPKTKNTDKKKSRVRKTHPVSSESDEEPKPKKKNNYKKKSRLSYEVSSESDEEPNPKKKNKDEKKSRLSYEVSSESDEEPNPKKKKNKDEKKSRLRKSYQVSSESEKEPGSPAVGISSGDEDMYPILTLVKSRKGAQNIIKASKAKVETPKKTQDHDDVERPILRPDLPTSEYGSYEIVIRKKSQNEHSNVWEMEGEAKAKTGSIAEDHEQLKFSEHSESTYKEGERAEHEDGKEVEGEAKVGSIAEDQQTLMTTDNSKSGDKDGERPTNKTENKDAKEVEGEAGIVGDQQMPKIRDQSEIANKDCERPKKKRRKGNDSGSAERPEKRKKTVNGKEGKEKQDEAKDEQNEVREVTESKRKTKKSIKRTEENSAAKAQLLVEDNKKTDAKVSKVQILQNGLTIEVLKSGESDSMVAVSGKKIDIRYECKLKSSGRVLESNYVKFRLGARKVTEGWEDGLEGIRVGEKRQLTVPPGVVKAGDGKNVPQDSWLVYEVELIKIR